MRADSVLAHPDPILGVQDLTLKVAQVHGVEVDEPDGPHPGRRQVERRRRPQAARTDQQDAGVEKLLLPLLADLGEQQVPAVPDLSAGGQGVGDSDVVSGLLPGAESA